MEEFNLSNKNNGRLKEGDVVKTRGDFGSFYMTIKTIHNEHYCTCYGYGKERHINMNVIEKCV